MRATMGFTSPHETHIQELLHPPTTHPTHPPTCCCRRVRLICATLCRPLNSLLPAGTAPTEPNLRAEAACGRENDRDLAQGACREPAQIEGKVGVRRTDGGLVCVQQLDSIGRGWLLVLLHALYLLPPAQLT